MTKEVFHIEDLGEPRFDPDTQEMLDLGAAMARDLDFTVAGICTAAKQQTGLNFFGSNDFEERMELLLRTYREEGNLSDLGTVSIHTQFTQFAKNRLLLEDLWNRHPEIEKINIERPIIIAGLPRTGTTHLHNLLAADPSLRSLPFWESVEPIPVAGEPATGDAQDPRWQRTEASCQFMEQAMPHFKRMHEMTVDHVHEEIHLLAMDFSSLFFDTLASIPTWRANYLATDQTPHYRYLKRVLQALTFLRGGKRWVLKSPQHLEQLVALRTVFPDATVLITHRDPVAVEISMVTMIAYTQRMQTNGVDLHQVGAYWADRLDELLNACLRDRGIWPDSQSLDIRFETFMADELAMVEQIYSLAGQPYDDQARANHRSYLATHERNRHGSIAYDAAQFGLIPQERSEVFRPYCERFGLQ